MGYARQCPGCGAYLDPEEVCDCTKKAASDATNIEDGKENLSTDTISLFRRNVK